MSESRDQRERQARLLAESIRRGDLKAAAEMLASAPIGKATAPPRPAPRAVPPDEPPDEPPEEPPEEPPRAAQGEQGEDQAEPAARTGPCLQYVRPARDSGAEAAMAGQFVSVLRGARQHFDELGASPGLCHVANAEPDHVLLVRVETHVVAPDDERIFLLGMLRQDSGRMRFEQFLAREATEEAAVLDTYALRRDEAAVVVTYPGRTSQRKCLAGRCHACEVEPGYRKLPHLDLRAEARRHWAGRLPNYRLGTMAAMLLGRPPEQGLSVNRIRQAYRAFLATGEAGCLTGLLAQNRAELCAMAQVLCLLLTGCDPLP
jgi:uncharacterized protein YprB with RNaseH-like and TPR domain